MDQQKEVLNAPMTVLGMVNGMIGGLILLLPVYTLHAGYFLSLIVIAISGFFSFYSCYLCVIHMGDQPDLDYTILRHFNGSRWPKIFYDFCIWISLIMIGLLYFELIMIQWEGLIPPHEFTFINPLVNGFVLFGLIFLLKYLELGASIMSYGIISIISYMIFLIWVIATSSQGDNDATPYPPFGSGAVDLAAAMAGAFQIQSFFIPVLKKNQKPQRYVFYTFMAYLVGGLAYCYIAFVGSVGTFDLSQESGTAHIKETNISRPLWRGISAATHGR
jgi:amino acid permease